MKRKRFSVELTVAAVKQAEMGMPMAELIRRVGSASRRYTAGRKKEHRALEVDQLRQLQQLQAEREFGSNRHNNSWWVASMPIRRPERKF